MTQIGSALTRQEFSLIEGQQAVHQRAKAFTDMPAKQALQDGTTEATRNKTA